MAEAQAHDPQAVGAWLVEEWASRLGGTLASMLDQPPGVEAGPVEAGEKLAAEAAVLGAAGGALAWWEQTFSLWPAAPFWVGVPEGAWSALGTRILEAAGVDTGGAAEVRGTFVELLAQSLESLAHGLGASAGVELLCGPRREADGPGEVSHFRRVQVRLGDQELPALVAAVSTELSGARLPGRGGAAEPAAPAAPSPPSRPQPPAGGASVEARMLELLLDVELPVSISFGRTRLPLKEALKLTTGSIVELNRGVGEPVDVIVNNCVIARGEVVVIEGNYGVRIREIMNRQALLRNLR